MGNVGRYLLVVWFTGPGKNVLGTDSNGRVVRADSTSVATACVSGAAALTHSANPRLSNREIEAILKNHGIQFFRPWDDRVGWGVPDAERSVRSARSHQ